MSTKGAKSAKKPFIDTGLSSSSAETSENMVRLERHFCVTTTGFSVFYADYHESARVNEGRRVSSRSPLFARAGKE